MTGTNPEEEIKRTFEVFDEDGDGLISAVEIKHAMMALGKSLTDEEADEMIREANVDGNGRIDYKEFAKMMSSK